MVCYPPPTPSTIARDTAFTVLSTIYDTDYFDTLRGIVYRHRGIAFLPFRIDFQTLRPLKRRETFRFFSVHISHVENLIIRKPRNFFFPHKRMYLMSILMAIIYYLLLLLLLLFLNVHFYFSGIRFFQMYLKKLLLLKIFKKHGT